MPLYIDFHRIDAVSATEEDMYKAHLKDIAVQNKYGLTYKKYYLNLPQKTACCLIEAPNKEACIASHMEAQGVGPCNVIEVSPEYEFFPYLGEGTKNDKDLALTLSGEIDTGYRTLMMICLSDFSGKCGKYIDRIYWLLEKHRGSKITQPNDEIMASFIHAQDAMVCSTEISRFLRTLPKGLEYNMALVTGKPVDETGSELFEEAKKRLHTLCRLGLGQMMHVDSNTKSLVDQESDIPDMGKESVRFVSESDFSLYTELWKILNAQITDPDFKSEHLYQRLGLSKAQTYRKITALTGMSPNTLIRELRLRKSLKALKNNHKTVAEIAYDLGFNSPTYFTRVFRNRYEVLPTSFAKLNAS